MSQSNYIPFNRGYKNGGCFFDNSTRYCLGDLWKIDKYTDHQPKVFSQKIGYKMNNKR